MLIVAIIHAAATIPDMPAVIAPSGLTKMHPRLLPVAVALAAALAEHQQRQRAVFEKKNLVAQSKAKTDNYVAK